MSTLCIQKSFGFHPLSRREVVAGFDGDDIATDAGYVPDIIEIEEEGKSL